ncbi:endonuclease domain-containing protein [Bacteroides sp. 51]|uniref:endonuclease domain-containing protein n=1 Tax=Bacteroides sp. 51 TaxID=2302938 RepID=UPI0013D5304E|nr:endonuclease domain-containing protein [Bacteroides sp. 51]NDV83332.1 endonuclease domain-containing protein [Bacteroides sp. 51]
MSNHDYNKKLQSNANSLRHTMTKAEVCLWKYALRAGMMCGYTFRRQRPIGQYIADFVSLRLSLVIEVDGASHLFEDTQINDMEKDKYLIQLGFTVLRFADEEVLRNIEGVKLDIERNVRMIEEKNNFLVTRDSSLTKNPPPAPASGG